MRQCGLGAGPCHNLGRYASAPTSLSGPTGHRRGLQSRFLLKPSTGLRQENGSTYVLNHGETQCSICSESRPGTSFSATKRVSAAAGQNRANYDERGRVQRGKRGGGGEI